ncbi:tRNA dimethylallyltransferase, partial [Frankliniella fusca]
MTRKFVSRFLTVFKFTGRPYQKKYGSSRTLKLRTVPCNKIPYFVFKDPRSTFDPLYLRIPGTERTLTFHNGFLPYFRNTG